ncbi:MAG: PPOX class F420-dependent oxidoreductase, partial [Solirubrobacteraceae bacterium]
ARARASARPVRGRRIPASLFFARIAARQGPPRGVRALLDAPRTGCVDDIRAQKRALLVTYKRDGTPVPTPVWAAADEQGRLYVRSERTAGKVKRLRRDGRLLVAPCTVRGRPLGAPLEARGRVLSPDEEADAERWLVARYGLGRALFERSVDVLRVDMCYVEIVAGGWDG